MLLDGAALLGEARPECFGRGERQCSAKIETLQGAGLAGGGGEIQGGGVADDNPDASLSTLAPGVEPPSEIVLGYGLERSRGSVGIHTVMLNQWPKVGKSADGRRRHPSLFDAGGGADQC
jgi:hypothetical protein